MRPCFPNYDKCILGIPHSILKHYGVQKTSGTLRVLDKELAQNYKNIIFMIFDGMGVDMLKKHMPYFSFIRRNIKDKMTSVFPPTTAAATTSYYSAQPPIEHGWLAWMCYFKEIDKVVELYPQQDFYTGEKIDTTDLFVQMRYEHIFDKIKKVSSVKTTEIFPDKIRPGGTTDIADIFNRVQKKCQEKEPQFILSYWTGPDCEAHHDGLNSASVKNVLKTINSELKKISKTVQDTLIIISADHGHIAIKNVVYVNEIEGFTECLRAPLSFDDRVSAIFLKQGKEEQFIHLFNTHLAGDFILMKKEDVIKNNLFGKGIPHKKFDDFIGDYLIISISGKSLRQIMPDGQDLNAHLVSSHAGLTSQEMIVPLILVGIK